MGRFVDRSIERLDLGDGDWVEIKTRLTYGERLAVKQKLLGIRMGLVNSSGEVTMPDELQFREGNLEVLMLSIMAWGGKGFCNQPAHPHDGACVPRPITKENIDSLDETGDLLLQMIENRMVQKTPDFTQPPSPSTSTAEAGAESSKSASTN